MKVLVLLSGLGLGNATRCHGVIQRLVERGAEVHVCTSGNGAWYFRGRAEIAGLHELEPLDYAAKDGEVDAWGTLAAARTLAAIARRNDHAIRAVLERVAPQVAVTDSVYSICALKRRGVPIVALNNADVVRASWSRFTDRPASVRTQFHLVEQNDYRFHRCFADRVVSPCLDPSLPECAGAISRVGPIVRRGCRPSPTEGPVRRVLLMLSGSSFGTRVALEAAPPGIQVDIVGRARPEGEPERPGITWHGRVRDNLAWLEAADLAVVNGGFSAVSELFSMRKPLLVIPVPRHAEQWVNGRTIVELGVGAIGSESTLSEDLRGALEQIEPWRARYRELPPASDGAEQAAELIVAARR